MKKKSNIKLIILLTASILSIFAAAVTFASEQTITLEMIKSAQNQWGEGLVKISKTHRDGGDARSAAEEVLKTLYDYPAGKVLFKPTLTRGKDTFRSTYEGALAYFVGGDKNFPEDTGFALNDFVSHRSELNSYVVVGDVAIAMGNIYLISSTGEEVMVDKTFAYRLDEDGKLRIIAHHSSLPFTMEKK